MLIAVIARPPSTYTTCSFLLCNSIQFHFSLLLCIVYICARIYFWLNSFYLWLVLVFLFNRVYYGFTPLRHRMSRHYMSRHVFVIDIIGHESFTSLFISSIQMLIECNGFDFESIESSISFVFGYGIW